MNICRGQNKENITLLYILWRGEEGLFTHVTLLFFIQGHTKNATCRILNLLKDGYHRRENFTYEELLKILDKKTQIKVIIMNTEDFMDYN